METFTETIPVTEGQPQTTITENVGVGVLCPNMTGVTFSSSSNGSSYTISLQESNGMSEQQSDVGFLVPNSAISSAESQKSPSASSPCKRPSSQFIFYRDAKLFSDDRYRNSSEVFVAGPVIASQLGRNSSVSNLQNPVEISFVISQVGDRIDRVLDVKY